MTLKVVGSIAAGDVPSQSVRQGAAIRIMTGAPLPDGADAVVPFEDTDEGERGMGGQTPGEISVRIPVPPGGNIRPAGGDIAAGATVIEAGTVLRASEIGVLASLGFGTVKVIRRPVAAILATGKRTHRAVGAVPARQDIQLQQLRRGGGGARGGRDSETARHRARHG